MKRPIQLPCLLALVLFLPGLSSARLSLDVTVGFDGAVMPQTWVPVLVELFNDGPPVEGFIQLTAPPPSRGVEYAKPVSLATNTRKRLWIYPFTGSYDREYVVRLVAPNGKVLAETPAQFQTLQPNHLLFASATRSELSLIPPSARANPEMPLHAARVRHVALPDDPAGYQGLQTLVLTEVPEIEWTPGQRRALRNWVALGGHLIVSVHNADNLIQSAFWEELLPLRVTGSEIAPNLGAIERIGRDSRPSRPDAEEAVEPPPTADAQTPVAVGELKAGSVRASAGNFPLVIDSALGRGRVTLLTFSVEREPFRSWQGKEQFWRGLAAVPSEPTGEKKSVSRFGQPGMAWGMRTIDDVFRTVLEARLERQISLWWLLTLIAVYLVVIGPFDYWLVRYRLKRPVLTWVTFPCYVVGFSALIYSIGYSLKSGDSEFVQVSFVDVIPEARLARGTTIAGFYSTSNRRFPFAGANAESHFRFTASGFENPGSPGVLGGDTEVTATEQGFAAVVPVPIWSSKTFVSDWIQPDARPIEVVVATEGSAPHLTITNRLAAPLQKVTVIARQRVHDLGELKPGGAAQWQVRDSGGTAFENWHGGLADAKTTQLLQQWGYSFRRYERRELPAWENLLPMLSFAERMPMQEYSRLRNWKTIELSKYLDNRSIIVLAYVENFIQGGIQPKFRPDRTEHHALLRCVVRAE